MRTPLLLAILALPLSGRAQLFGAKFQPGSYILNDNRSVRYQGQLRLHKNAQLDVRDENGKTTRLPAAQVYAARIGEEKFISVKGFRLRGDIDVSVIESGFVEQLDSGRVTLLSYTYSTQYAPTMSMGGGMTGGGKIEVSVWLLRRNGANEAMAVTGSGPAFRDVVRPFLAERPDLVKMLDDKLIVYANLRRAIRALNTNGAFVQPPFPN